MTFDVDARCGQTTAAYVQTRDETFQTPESVSIGWHLRDAAKTTGASLEKIDGRCGVLLASGWIARPGTTALEDTGCDSILDEPIAYFDTRFLDG